MRLVALWSRYTSLWMVPLFCKSLVFAVWFLRRKLLLPSVMSSFKMLSFVFVSFSIIQCWTVTPPSARNSLIYAYAYVPEHQDSISSFFSIIPFYCRGNHEDSFLGVFVSVLFFLPSFCKSCQFCSSLEVTFACNTIGVCSLLLTRLYTCQSPLSSVSECQVSNSSRYVLLTYHF